MNKEKIFLFWRRWRVFVYLALTVLAFSSIEIVTNPIRNRIDPFALTFWRFLLGALCLFPLMVGRKKFHFLTIPRRDWLWLGLLGCLNVILSMGAHALSMKYAKASTAAVLIAANPIATNFFAWLILKEKLDRRRVTFMIIGILGVGLIALRPSTGADTPFGIAAGIVGMVGFALYTVLSKEVVQRFGSLTVTTLSFLLAALVYFPMLLCFKVPLWPDPEVWPRLLVLGIVLSGFGYLTFFKALKELPAGKASLLFFFKTPVSLLLAWLFLAETPTPLALIGCALIMMGVLFDRKSEALDVRREAKGAPAFHA